MNPVVLWLRLLCGGVLFRDFAEVERLFVSLHPRLLLILRLESLTKNEFGDMAGPQQPTKRGAETEAQPAPVVKRASQQPEQKDIQHRGAVQPASETNQTATKQTETSPTGDLNPVEHNSVSSQQGDGAYGSAQARAQQLAAEAAKAQDKLEQAVKEVTEKQKEAVKASEEAFKEAVAANAATEESEKTKETKQDDKTEESVQNGASHTPDTKPAIEDEVKIEKEDKESNKLGENKIVPPRLNEALPANENVVPQALTPQGVQFTDSNMAFSTSNPLPQGVTPPVVNGQGIVAPQMAAQNLAAAQAPFVPETVTPLLGEIRTTPLSNPGEDKGPAPMQEG